MLAISAMFAGCVFGIDNTVVRYETQSSEAYYMYVGKLYVGPLLTLVPVYYNVSSDDRTLFPELALKAIHPHASPGNNVEVNVYVNRMKHNRVVSGVVTPGDVVSLSPRDLNEITFVSNLYSTTFVYYGEPPREILPHITERRCANDVILGPGIDAHVFVVSADKTGVVPVVLSLSRTSHLIGSAIVCGNVEIIFDRNIHSRGVPVWIDCASSVEISGTSQLSLQLLSLGIHLSTTGMSLGNDNGSNKCCIFLANNNEIDHQTTSVMLALLGLGLSAWIYLTHGLYLRMQLPGTSQQVWERVSVAVSTQVTDVYVMAASLVIALAINQNHNAYSFEALQMVSKEFVDIAIMTFAFVLVPFISIGVLFALIVGNILYGKQKHELSIEKWFSWGSITLGERPWQFRCVVAVLVFSVGTVGIVLLWVYIVHDNGTAVALGVGTLLTLVHLSNPHIVERWITSYIDTIETILPLLLLFLRWGFECVVIMCIQFYLPIDVMGTLMPRFHVGVGIGLGCELLIITGRDIATMIRIGKNRLSSKISFGVEIVILLCMSGCVILIVSVFSLGAMFANSEALRNKESLSLGTSVAVSTVIFVGSFVVWSVDNVGTFPRPSIVG